jgi:hypothetical protein
MSQSSHKDIFCLPELGEKKNGRRICPISDDLGSTHTLATPQNSPSTRPACLAAQRRSRRHDA